MDEGCPRHGLVNGNQWIVTLAFATPQYAPLNSMMLGNNGNIAGNVLEGAAHFGFSEKNLEICLFWPDIPHGWSGTPKIKIKNNVFRVHEDLMKYLCLFLVH